MRSKVQQVLVHTDGYEQMYGRKPAGYRVWQFQYFGRNGAIDAAEFEGPYHTAEHLAKRDAHAKGYDTIAVIF